MRSERAHILKQPKPVIMSSPLSISFTNIRSILSKCAEASSFLEDSDPDIIAFTETWLHPDILDCEVLSGSSSFNIYRRDRIHRRGGGVLLGIEKSITSFSIKTDSDLEIIWTACITSPTKLLIGNCYRAPNSDHSFSDKLRESIARALELFHADITYLFGDFNFPQIDWTLLSSPCTVSSGLIDLTLDFNLFQVVTQPTRGPEYTRPHLYNSS